MSNKRKTCLLLICFVVLLYGTYLGLIPLLDPDEPVYGETAKEMLLTGDWLSPRIYGEFWYDKPPLFYWLEAISFKLFGLSTWSARLPSVLATLISVLFLHFPDWGKEGPVWCLYIYIRPGNHHSGPQCRNGCHLNAEPYHCTGVIPEEAV